MSEAIACPCPHDWQHDPHFYVSAIVGGDAGPVPMVSCVCPGVDD